VEASSPELNVTLPKPNTTEEENAPPAARSEDAGREPHPLEQKGYVLPHTHESNAEVEGSKVSNAATNRQFLYTFKNSLSLRGGVSVQSGGNSLTTLGLAVSPAFWRNDPSDPLQFELNLDWLSNARGHIFGTYKYSFHPRERLRPFAKASLDLRLEPQDGLVSPLRLDRYGVRLGGGTEYTIRTNLSLRADLEYYQGVKDSYFVAVLGYAWGW